VLREQEEGGLWLGGDRELLNFLRSALAGVLVEVDEW